MKKILVPYDFSDACENALHYAVEFALVTRQQISLLNVYNFAVTSSVTIVPIPSAGSLIEERLHKLDRIRTRIRKQHPTLEITCHCEPGTVIETINTFVHDHRIDLIIMGMQGGGFLSERIIGSTTTSLMRQSACPILGIGRHVHYKPLKRIGFATDYEDAAYKKFLKPLKQLTDVLGAHLFLFHIEDPEVKHHRLLPGTRLLNALEGIPYTVHTARHTDIAKGIDEFVKDEAIDMIAIIPRKHSFFQSLLNEPQTKRLAFHTRIPLLTLYYE